MASTLHPPSAPARTRVAADAASADPHGARAGRLPVSALALLAATAYAVHDWQRYATFRSAGFDVGIFDQAIRHYARFQAPVSSLKGVGFSLLGDHFSPILAVLAPLFWIWPDTRMLAIVLGALIGASVFPVHAFCSRRLDSGLALTVTAAYVFWWPLQGLAGYEFHEIAFAVPLVAWLIDALDRGRQRTVLALCLVLLSVREDMGFVLLMVALILAHRRELRLAGLLAVIGLASFELITKVIVPGFAPDGTWAYWAYPALGSDAQSATAHILLHPLSTARLFVEGTTKKVLLVCLFLPPTVLALCSPYVLLAVPILVERLLSSRSSLWSIDYQYNAILAPIIVLAAVDTLGRCTRRATRASGMARVAVVSLFALTVVGGTTIVGSLYPLREVFTGADWGSNARVRSAPAILAQIPAHACVEADDRLIPHLIGRDYIVPPNGSEDIATWLAVDTSVGNTGGGVDLSPQARLRLARAEGFHEIARAGPMRLLRRALPANPLCAQVD